MDFRPLHGRTISGVSYGSNEEQEHSSPSSVQSVPATFARRTQHSHLQKPPSRPYSVSASPDRDAAESLLFRSFDDQQRIHAENLDVDMQATITEAGSGTHKRTMPASATLNSRILQHSATSQSSAEAPGQFLHSLSVRSSPAHGRLRGADSTSSKLDILRQLSDIIKGRLTVDNLDQFMSAYSKLRAQVHLSRGDSQGTNTDSMELKARSLLREGADKLEGAFRKVLEDETRAADACRLLRCASTRLDAGDEDSTEAPLAPQSAFQNQDEFPGFQTSKRTPPKSPELLSSSQTNSPGKIMSARESRRSGAPLPLFPEPDGYSAPASSSSSSHPPSRRQSIRSLPLFPTDEAAEDGGELLEENPEDRTLRFNSSRDSQASPRKELICDDLRIPGVKWETGTPSEDRILASGEAVAKLKRLAKAMIDSGLEESCLRIYRDIRGLKVIASLKVLDLGPKTVQEVERLTTKQADESIKNWKRQIKISMHSVMAGERKLCSEVFSSASWLSDQASHAIGEEVLDLLFPVADALADGMKSEAKLVLLLDLYETLVYLMPFLNEGFPEGACSDLRLKAAGLLDKVKRAVKQGFRRFSDFIEAHALEEVPNNGSYPERGLLTYAMNIVEILSGYKETLEAVFEKAQLKEVLEELMGSLERSIEKQARQYDNDAKAEFFMMNSLRHIAFKFNDLSLKEIIGERWVNRRNRQVQQHAQAYQRIAWGPTLAILDSRLASGPLGSDDGLDSPDHPSTGGTLRRIFRGSRDNPKERLEEFSQAFARIYWDHRCWLIPDKELRSAIQVQLTLRLLDRYKPCIEQMGKGGSGFLGRRKSQNTMFTVEALQSLVDELFTGQPPQGGEVPVDMLLKMEQS